MKPAAPDARAPAPTDMRLCPVCGQANQCAMEIEKATGQPQPPCWCVSVSFSDTLLAALPNTARSCICASCAQAQANPPDDGH